jgi:hypothetical protein
MTKTEYAETLKGSRWQELRKDVLTDRPFCAKCDMPRWLAAIAYDQDLHVHHKSYANRGTDKEYEDLDPLCRRCHDIETFGRSDLKAPKNSKCTICGSTHWNPYESFCPTCTALTVSSEQTYFCLNKIAPDFGDAPLWAVTMRWGIKSSGSAAMQYESCEIAMQVLLEVHRQINFALRYPNGISDDDIAPIVEPSLERVADGQD